MNDSNALYCTGPCANGMCPDGYFCAELQGGDTICARGEPEMMEELPGQGEPCTPRGLCANGLFCLNDSSNVDENTGRTIPYCTSDCSDGRCEDGYRCIDIRPSGTACQLIPNVGQRRMGDDCWVNPEAPWEPPTCGGDLVCVGYVIENQVVTDKGTCTKNCSVEDCCPVGWGCIELTPVFGQCQPDKPDSPRFMCDGERPTEDGNAPDGTGQENIDGGINVAPSGGSGGGCAQVDMAPLTSHVLFSVLAVALGYRRWQRR